MNFSNIALLNPMGRVHYKIKTGLGQMTLREEIIDRHLNIINVHSSLKLYLQLLCNAGSRNEDLRDVRCRCSNQKVHQGASEN